MLGQKVKKRHATALHFQFSFAIRLAKSRRLKRSVPARPLGFLLPPTVRTVHLGVTRTVHRVGSMVDWFGFFQFPPLAFGVAAAAAAVSRPAVQFSSRTLSLRKVRSLLSGLLASAFRTDSNFHSILEHSLFFALCDSEDIVRRSPDLF